MSAWTEEQDDVLREVSFHGAAFAAEEIERRCGVRHSVRAVEMRASRIHCSLALQTVCPECGAVGVKINRQTGMCPLCTEKYHLEQERAFNEQLERERAEIEKSGELEATRRERDRLRQRNSRLCRKYGLKSRKERKSRKNEVRRGTPRLSLGKRPRLCLCLRLKPPQFLAYKPFRIDISPGDLNRDAWLVVHPTPAVEHDAE